MKPNGKINDNINKTVLSPEEYVTTLYRVLLRREPDSGGLAHHVTELRDHGDHTRVISTFLHSEEFKELELRDRHMPGDRHMPQFSDSVGDFYNTELIIECSRNHFDDVSFIENLSKKTGIFKRIKRKIKTIAVYYPKMRNGGTERVTARQILAWSKLGYRVILLTDLPVDAKNDYDYGEVERFIIPPKMMDNHDYRPRGRALAALLKEQEVDVFVNNLWDETSTVWDVLTAKSLGIPVVVGWHNIFDTRIRNSSDLRLANMRFSGYRYADLVTVLSTVDKLWFSERGVTSRVVYNPLTFDKLPDKIADLDDKTIVWVARAERHQKRLDLAIKMFPLVLQAVPDARLIIVGGGPDLEWAKEYAASLGIERSVNFVGYTTNVAHYLAQSSVHILTSEFEGWCLAIGEAWAYGIPTVMFNLPNIEYVQQGKGFIGVEMHDIVAMADAVSGLLLDADRRKALGAQARSVAEEFDKVDVAEEWQRIFDDIERRNDLDTPIDPDREIRGLRTLCKQIGDRMLNLDSQPSQDYVPVLPSAEPVEAPRSATGRNMLRIGQNIRAPYIKVRRLFEKQFVPDRRLRMIDLSHVGLGDNVMIWTGLFTLLENGVEVCAEDCVMHVQPLLVDLARCFFAPFGLEIRPGQPERQASPIYTPLPPNNWKEWWGSYVGRDWRMNWVEALDLQKTFPRRNTDRSFRSRVRLNLSEWMIYRRFGWARATPGYIGYRVWLPLAQQRGVYPLQFLAQMKRSLLNMRRILGGYVDALTSPQDVEKYHGNAAFPAGKSFQTIAPHAFARIQEDLGGDFFTCYMQNDSAWKGVFETSGIVTRHVDSLNDTLRIIKYSDNLLTTDSFTSHIAQLIRDDFVLVLSRDMKEGILHPGSNPTILANHPPCAPCNYQERFDFDCCVAGYATCAAFDSPAFIDRIATAFKP